MQRMTPEGEGLLNDGELADWLSRLVDGRLTADESARLERQLAEDPAALVAYCDFIDTEFMLAWELKCRGAEDGQNVMPLPSSAASSAKRVASWIMPLVLLGAGYLAAWFVAAWYFDTRSDGPPTQTMAILSRANGAVWKSRSEVSVGLPLPAGPIALFEGTAQLTFPTGAVVAVHAPAEVEVLGQNRLMLRRGRITPFVPESAKGFSVVSPTGEVIDLGTEFSMSVGEDGRTDVFVIDGEVDVGLGQLATVEPMRLTQGFATALIASGAKPVLTQRPLLVERFEAPSPLFRRIDRNSDSPPLIAGGELRIPMEGHPDEKDPTVQLVLDQDLSPLAGRKSTISYKLSLPSGDGLSPERWAGLAIVPGEGHPPWAHQRGAAVGILMSPLWQVGLYLNGEQSEARMPIWPRGRTLFPRGSEAIGPYQVVITIDDSPAVRKRLGAAAFGFMVNGVEFVRDHQIGLDARPRIVFQTFFPRGISGIGYAAIDDFSISVEALADAEAS